jgi:hypothetical protein
MPKCEYTYSSHQRCENEAIHKCTGHYCNGGVYCVKHIQFIDLRYICDICKQEQNRISQKKLFEEALAREKAEKDAALTREAAREIAASISKIRAAREAAKKPKLDALMVSGWTLIALDVILTAVAAQTPASANNPGTQIVFALGAVFFVIAIILFIVRSKIKNAP